MSLLVLVIHCQFGGRPLMTAVLQEILQYIGKSPDVWFARHEELANWALAGRRRGAHLSRAVFRYRQPGEVVGSPIPDAVRTTAPAR